MRFLWVLLIQATLFATTAIMAYAQPGMPLTQKYSVHPDLRFAQLPQADTSFSACEFNGGVMLRQVDAAWKGERLHIQFMGMDAGKSYRLELVLEGGRFQTKLFIMAADEPSVQVEATDQVLVVDRPIKIKAGGFSGYINFRGSVLKPEDVGRPWNAQQDWVDSKYTVSGPFKVRW